MAMWFLTIYKRYNIPVFLVISFSYGFRVAGLIMMMIMPSFFSFCTSNSDTCILFAGFDDFSRSTA